MAEPQRRLGKGDRGDDVEAVQRALNRSSLGGEGWNIEVDGIWGDETRARFDYVACRLGLRREEREHYRCDEHAQRVLLDLEEKTDEEKQTAERRKRENGCEKYRPPESAKVIDRFCPDEKYGALIVEEAKRSKLALALACALVEQESGFRNIFGCDLGKRSSAPWCHQEVTRDRVNALIRHVRGGGQSNGVGLTQLTSIGFIDQAERLGGAHEPRNQLRVGFDLLVGHMRSLGERTGIGAYNGGSGNPQLGYADDVLALKRKWQARLD